jgi:tetratricopeptide (TPR) repeat protein
VRGRATQSKLVDELVRVGASDENRNQQIGRSLFKLLVPAELEPFLSGSSSVLLQLDSATAAYPWELLDTQRDDQHDDARPWAVRTRMLRKLRTSEFRNHPVDARRETGALVIGEPQCDPLKYPPLPGASDEALAVAEILGVQPQLKLDVLAVVNAVLDRPYRVIHIAGHGDFLEDRTGGVVLSNDTVFGPREVEAMRTVPELAFINCCYLGKIDSGSAMKASPLGGKRPSFAANVAEELIRIGVRCVVAAGWAVDDGPAKLFATCFYQALTRGRSFAEAVGFAREKTREGHPGSNTWAAYQCYGEPDWRYATDNDVRYEQLPEMSVVVSPADLELELATLAVRSKYGTKAQNEVRTRLEQLQATYAGPWGSLGAIAQAFGEAYSELGELEDAIRWYSRAVSAEDGSASLRASEQLGNLRARRGGRIESKAEARREILTAIRQLERLLAIDATSERASLVGSAFKRLVTLEAKSGRTAASREAIGEMAKYYRQAEDLARRNNSDNLFYPAANRMSAELVLNVGRPNWPGFDAGDIAAVRQSLQRKAAADPDFWSVVGLTELRIYEMLADRKLAKALDSILNDLADVKARANAPRKWASVRDQAEFTLSPYIGARELPAPEREAARKLLKQLQDYAAK